MSEREIREKLTAICAELDRARRRANLPSAGTLLPAVLGAGLAVASCSASVIDNTRDDGAATSSSSDLSSSGIGGAYMGSGWGGDPRSSSGVGTGSDLSSSGAGGAYLDTGWGGDPRSSSGAGTGGDLSSSGAGGAYLGTGWGGEPPTGGGGAGGS